MNPNCATRIRLCPCKCSHLEPLVCIHIFTSIHVLYHKYSQVYEPKLCNSHLCAQCASAFGASAVAAPSAAAAAHGAPWTHRICHFEHVIQLGGCWFWAGTTIKLISRIWPKTMVGGFMLFVYFIRLNDYLQMGTNHFQTRQYVYLVDRSSIHVWNKIVFPSDIVCANPHWSYLSWLHTFPTIHTFHTFMPYITLLQALHPSLASHTLHTLHTVHTLHYITLHYIPLHYIPFHSITLLYITFNYLKWHYVTLHDFRYIP
jgi:hypothetical protein